MKATLFILALILMTPAPAMAFTVNKELLPKFLTIERFRSSEVIRDEASDAWILRLRASVESDDSLGKLIEENQTDRIVLGTSLARHGPFSVKLWLATLDQDTYQVVGHPEHNAIVAGTAWIIELDLAVQLPKIRGDRDVRLTISLGGGEGTMSAPGEVVVQWSKANNRWNLVYGVMIPDMDEMTPDVILRPSQYAVDDRSVSLDSPFTIGVRKLPTPYSNQKEKSYPYVESRGTQGGMRCGRDTLEPATWAVLGAGAKQQLELKRVFASAVKWQSDEGETLSVLNPFGSGCELDLRATALKDFSMKFGSAGIFTSWQSTTSYDDWGVAATSAQFGFVGRYASQGPQYPGYEITEGLAERDESGKWMVVNDPTSEGFKQRRLIPFGPVP